jgi:hypothetical protein
MIHLPRGIPVKQKVNPARINLPEAMQKLRKSKFTGCLRFDAPQGVGMILFQGGQLSSALFMPPEMRQHLIAYDAISRIFEVSIQGDASLNIDRLSADLILGLHALFHGQLQKAGLALDQLNVAAELQRIKDEGLTVCLRVYAGKRTSLIFYDHGHALGFFHDGTAELQTTADISTSVAAQPGARLDILEICGLDEIVLADLMSSADLRPIWARARKKLMEQRDKREELEIRSREQQHEKQREQLLLRYKTIAGTHIGKFGATQVDKAFAAVGQELKPEQLEHFYRELNQLARLVVGQAKINAMIDEMKKEYAKIK